MFLAISKNEIKYKCEYTEGWMQAAISQHQQQSAGKKALKTPKIKDILVLLCRYMEGALGYGIESKAKNI